MLRRKTKAQRADDLAARAGALFTSAHEGFSTAIDLLEQAEREHTDLAVQHSGLAAQAAGERARHERVRDRTAGLLA